MSQIIKDKLAEYGTVVKNTPYFYGKEETLSVMQLKNNEGYTFCNEQTGDVHRGSFVRIGRHNIEGFVLTENKNQFIEYLNPINGKKLHCTQEIYGYESVHDFWKKLLQVSPEDFSNLPTSYFEKGDTKEQWLQDYLTAIKQALRQKVRGETATEADIAYANEILTMVTEKIVKEKEAIAQRDAKQEEGKARKAEYDSIVAKIDELGKTKEEENE